MKKKSFILLVLLCFVRAAVFSQSFVPPAQYEFASPSDYLQHRDQAIEAMKWLILRPMNHDREQRQQINLYVEAWLSGNPLVNLDCKKPSSVLLPMKVTSFFPKILSWFTKAGWP